MRRTSPSHRHGDAPVAGVRERSRLHARVDLLELAAPVVAHGGAPVHAPALEGVGPVDVAVQGGDDRVDVAGVEGGVEVAQQRFVIHARSDTARVYAVGR
jgi:hypothetical protein